MTFDGLPHDLQYFSSKICFFSLKLQTLPQKICLPYIDTVKIRPRTSKIDPQNHH